MLHRTHISKYMFAIYQELHGFHSLVTPEKPIDVVTLPIEPLNLAGDHGAVSG